MLNIFSMMHDYNTTQYIMLFYCVITIHEHTTKLIQMQVKVKHVNIIKTKKDIQNK